MSGTRRFPIVSTIVVVAAVALMIALGLWQLLDRAPKKEAFIAQLAGNPARPPVAFPLTPDDRLLFRRTRATCIESLGQALAGAGAMGYRVIATCRTDAGATPIQVQLGTTRDPNAKVAWRGGAVTGFVSHAPDSRSLISGLFDRRPQAMLLVAKDPPAGLTANLPPDLNAVPNNHVSYAGQWFFFAAIATVIYILAVRRRVRPQASGRVDTD